MPISLRDKFDKFAGDPRSKSAADKYKKVETGVWRALDPLGKGVNRLAGKLGAESFWPTEIAEGEVEKAARILRTFTLEGAGADEGRDAENNGGVSNPTGHHDAYDARKTQKVLRKIPQKAIQGACGLAVFTCFRTGFGFSGSGGSGLVVARLPDGSWSPPSGVLIHTLSYGFSLGIDVYDVVLIIRQPETLKAFTHPKLSIGAEFSASAGPVGNGAVLDAGTDGKPVWSYTKSKGVYLGIQLDGTVILKRDDANARFYGRSISTADIFAGTVPPPPAARPLMQTLYAAEGRPQVMGTDAIPQGQAPGDRPLSDEERQALSQGPAPQTSSTNVGAGSSSEGPASTAPPSELPPAYEEDDAFASMPPPPAESDAPRDAAAEKEALRRRYETEDAGTSSQYGNAPSSSTGAGAGGPSGLPRRVRAQYDFNGTEEEDLSFREGQIIDVTGAAGDQWYHGTFDGRRGSE